jgi:hypothetical protein
MRHEIAWRCGMTIVRFKNWPRLFSFNGNKKGASNASHVANDVLYRALFRDLDRKLFRDIRSLKADFGISAGETAEDTLIIDRIVDAYKQKAASAAKPSGIWEHIYNTRQMDIHNVLIGNHRDAVENLLRRPGDSNLFYGFDGTVVEFVQKIKRHMNEGPTFAKLPHDHLLRAAEIMGALPYEHIDGGGPDANIASYGSMPTDKIIDAMDRHLGVSLKFQNPFPDEFGVQTSRGIVSYHVPHAIYHAWRIRELVKNKNNPRVLEIGGGLGRAAYFAWQLGIKDYTIIDLPLTGVSQAYFLMRTLGEDNVILQGEESPKYSNKVKLHQPSVFLDGLERYDIIINANSMTEMSREAAQSYWNRIRNATTRFLSINHEANPFTIRQLATADAEHVKASQRYPYGLRKSYAEEIFEFELVLDSQSRSLSTAHRSRHQGGPGGGR